MVSTQFLSHNLLPATTLMSDERAQTLNDFAIGTTIFLFTVLFVFAFVPSIFSPFGLQSGTGDAINVDRSAEHLTNSVLSDSDQPMVIDGECTQAFFSNTTVSGCEYSPEPMAQTLGHGDTYRPMNITIETQSGSTVTYNSVDLTRGDSPTTEDEITAVRRVVYLDGNTYGLVVKTW